MVGPDDYLRLNNLYTEYVNSEIIGEHLDWARSWILTDGTTNGDPSLYVNKINGHTIGMLGSYVDDCLFAGNEEFKKHILKMKQKFDAKPVESDNFEFPGVHIHAKRKSDQLWSEISQLD